MKYSLLKVRGGVFGGLVYGSVIIGLFGLVIWFVSSIVDPNKKRPPLVIDWSAVERPSDRIERVQEQVSVLLDSFNITHEAIELVTLQKIADLAQQGELNEDFGWPDTVAEIDEDIASLDSEWRQSLVLQRDDAGALNLFVALADRFVANAMVQTLEEKGYEAKSESFQGRNGIVVTLTPPEVALRQLVNRKVGHLKAWLDTLVSEEELLRQADRHVKLKQFCQELDQREASLASDDALEDFDSSDSSESESDSFDTGTPDDYAEESYADSGFEGEFDIPETPDDFPDPSLRDPRADFLDNPEERYADSGFEGEFDIPENPDDFPDPSLRNPRADFLDEPEERYADSRFEGGFENPDDFPDSRADLLDEPETGYAISATGEVLTFNASMCSYEVRHEEWLPPEPPRTRWARQELAWLSNWHRQIESLAEAEDILDVLEQAQRRVDRTL